VEAKETESGYLLLAGAQTSRWASLITIDITGAYTETARFTPSGNYSLAGHQVVDPNHPVIGAPGWINGVDSYTGTVYSFDPSNGYTQTQILSPLPAANKWFGDTLAGDGPGLPINSGLEAGIGRIAQMQQGLHQVTV